MFLLFPFWRGNGINLPLEIVFRKLLQLNINTYLLIADDLEKSRGEGRALFVKMHYGSKKMKSMNVQLIQEIYAKIMCCRLISKCNWYLHYSWIHNHLVILVVMINKGSFNEIWYRMCKIIWWYVSNHKGPFWIFCVVPWGVLWV